MGYAIGLVELQALVAAIETLDVMLKTANVEFVAVERKLGGRLVTLVIRGDVGAVEAAVEAGCAAAERMGHLKAHEVIARPHPEILKFLHLDEDE